MISLVQARIFFSIMLLFAVVFSYNHNENSFTIILSCEDILVEAIGKGGDNNNDEWVDLYRISGNFIYQNNSSQAIILEMPLYIGSDVTNYERRHDSIIEKKDEVGNYYLPLISKSEKFYVPKIQWVEIPGIPTQGLRAKEKILYPFTHVYAAIEIGTYYLEAYFKLNNTVYRTNRCLVSLGPPAQKLAKECISEESIMKIACPPLPPLLSGNENDSLDHNDNP